MRLEMMKEAELVRRKGLAIRTIIAIIWLAISIVAGYFVTSWLIENEIIRFEFFYTRLFIPRGISKEALQGAIVLIIVMIMQSFIVVGYGFGSQAGRRRPGTPSAFSRHPDPQDKMYYS